MIRELVIHSNTKGVEIALLENKRLMEYHLDPFDQSGFSAGDIFLGRVKKLNPGLNAAFIDIGHEKDAFIHYSDLSPSLLSLKKFTSGAVSGKQGPFMDGFKLEAEINKNGKIQDVLTKGDLVITQIMKEAISTKGPRMTCEVTIPGRYVVLAPFTNSIGISKKITDAEERHRLTDLIESIRPRNFGLVVRTNAQGLGEAELRKDIEVLMEKWQLISMNMQLQTPPRLLLSEMGKSFSLIRDMLNDSFERVVTDNAKLHDQLSNYLEENAPQHAGLLQLYKGMRPLFDEFDITRQVRNAFGKTVTLKSGAYLVVEHTEALHVIDVNSGPKINTTVDQDTNAFNVNCEAAIEIARQMRLRDIGGIIVVDFIDMRSGEYRVKVMQAMEEAMRSDRAKHSILPISKFGLMEITRQRVRSETNVETEERHPKHAPDLELPENILLNIEREVMLVNGKPGKKYNLFVHPYVSAYLEKGFFPMKWRWFFRTKLFINIIEDPALALSEFYLLHRDRNPAGQAV
jgi:ribonuclease G